MHGDNMDELIVNYDDTLLNYLLKNINNKSKNNIKSLLKNGQISVNGKVITKHDYNIHKYNKISINYNIDRSSDGLDIIYEDNEIIVVDKPHSLLTISTDKVKDATLYQMVSKYLKNKNKANKVFIVHRLDKETSGVVVFAKNKHIQELLQNNWDNIVKKREYVAIVQGILDKKEDTIESYLTENKLNIVYSTKNKQIGKLAITSYKVLKENKNYSYLLVNLSTGKKNQIRVHMSEMGHSIVGDKKYGSKINPLNRLGLHASTLELIHPITKKTLVFKSKVPRKFDNLFKTKSR